MNNVTAWTYFQAQRWAASQLHGSAADPHAPQFILQMRHDWDETHLLLNNRQLMPPAEQEWFKTAISRLKRDEPAQYIVGKAPFYGRPFKVSQDVLIPEPETAELVEWILHDIPDRPLTVLDLGTGSGAIGITLALERPQWQVTLSDISAAALEIARQNSQQLGAHVSLVQSDLFEHLAGQRFDLIVTNPPYVNRRDTKLMDRSVLKYEPALALFADEGGLGFYHRLFLEAGTHLTANGQLYGETGFDQERSIQQLLARCDHRAKIVPRHDVAGKMRMIHVWDFSDAGGR
jgi:release factor glutamine methyltransferase